MERYKESSYHGAAVSGLSGPATRTPLQPTHFLIPWTQASLIVYELAKKLARENNDLLWCVLAWFHAVLLHHSYLCTQTCVPVTSSEMYLLH